MKVIPERLADLAEGFQRSAEIVRDGWTDGAAGLTVAADAAGDTANGPRLVAAHAAAAEAAEHATGRLAAVFEADMDDLYACAFDFATTDEEQAERYRSELPRIGPFPYRPEIDWSVYNR